MKYLKPKYLSRLQGLGFAVLLMLNTGCYYDQVLPVEPEGEISYSIDIQSFFDAKCNSCHGGGVAPNLSAPDSYSTLFSGGYINTSNPESSSLYTEIDVGGGMESYATPSQRALVLKWIEQGALDN